MFLFGGRCALGVFFYFGGGEGSIASVFFVAGREESVPQGVTQCQEHRSDSTPGQARTELLLFGLSFLEGFCKSRDPFRGHHSPRYGV